MSVAVLLYARRVSSRQSQSQPGRVIFPVWKYQTVTVLVRAKLVIRKLVADWTVLAKDR